MLVGLAERVAVGATPTVKFVAAFGFPAVSVNEFAAIVRTTSPVNPIFGVSVAV